MNSPGFSKFRELMDIWDEYLIIQESEDQIAAMIDTADFVFFFTKDANIFGAGEESRMVFAQMKKPNDDLPKNWDEDASFSAENLEKMAKGEPSTHIFSNNDLDKIKIIDREEAIQKLTKVVKGDIKAVVKTHSEEV